MLRAVSLTCGDAETLAAARQGAGDVGLVCAAAWSDAAGSLPARAAIADMLRGADAAFVVRDGSSGPAPLGAAARELAEAAGVPVGAVEFGVTFYPVYLAWLRRARPGEHCLVIPPGVDPVALQSVLTSVWTEAGSGPPTPIVPYKDLFDIYFRHIQHEANWVNSRFMWCMFANSALLGFLNPAREEVVTLCAVFAGLLITLSTLILQWVTFGAEDEAIRRTKAVVAEWKQRVPQVGNLLYDTPAGGDSEWRHRLARWLMYALLAVLLGLWCVLAALWLSRRLI